ncbi:MAG: hypothetical protein M1828_001861 [Chrysothrix sp. TS-e1954]|nr:MAG: hypothetical protein M1828_001861 [Chrysothrix sp. TS-e1954]
MASAGDQIERKGSCLCGHCTNCAKATGSAFGFFALFPLEAYNLTEPIPSPLKTYADRATQSGNALVRGFCSDCGSTMFTKTPLAQQMVIVAMGTLDDKRGIEVGAEYYTPNKVRCIPGVEGAKVFESNT